MATEARERTLARWPERIYVKQEGRGGHTASVYDAATGEQLKMVFVIVVQRDKSVVKVTASKYEPYRMAIEILSRATTEQLGLPPDPDFNAEILEGLIVETREYPIAKLALEAGV